MADVKKERVKKKKAKEDGAASEEASAAASAAESAAASAAATPKPAASGAASGGGSSRGSRGSRKAKRSGSNVFSMFTQKQVAEFKEAFQLMDHDKDGIIGKGDLRATMDSLGKLANEKELDEMLAEAPGPLNFTQLLSLFGTRMQQSGGDAGNDDDDVVIAAFKTFDSEGVIDSDNLRHALMTWGDKFTAKEVDDAFDQMDMDDKGFIDTARLIAMLTGKEEEGEEGGEAA